jgi:tRNA threonylcarbamoyladenosine modification (KEOPS) complex Cgi121 subunit
MLQQIEEFGVYAEITGFKEVKFSDAEAFLKESRKNGCLDVELQVFDAELIATSRHLYFAVLNALHAFRNKTNLSKSLAVETMLYASAQRQIQRAIQRCGIKPQTQIMAVTIIGQDPAEIYSLLRKISLCVGAEPDETMLEMTAAKLEKIKEVFQIKNEEINAVMKSESQNDAVVSLVVERVAMLATQL